MDAIFNKQEEAVSEVVVEANSDKAEKKAAKKEQVAELRTLFRETLQQDPSYLERRHLLSNTLKVTKTLGYGTSGNVMVDKVATAKAKAENPDDKDVKVLKTIGKIVGYTIKNVGTEAIQYVTEVFTQDETGKFVGQKVEKTLAPNEEANISRSYLAMLTAKPEFAFKLANGTLISKGTSKGELEDILSKFYFSFDKDLGINVNDDEIKVSIDADGVVKPEFVEVFGYLNNPKEKKAGKSKEKYTTQELMANFVNNLIKEGM